MPTPTKDLPERGNVKPNIYKLTEGLPFSNTLPEYASPQAYNMLSDNEKEFYKPLYDQAAIEQVRREAIQHAISLIQNMEWGVMDNDIDAKELLAKLNSFMNNKPELPAPGLQKKG